jgi:hypothetical protein
MVGVSRESLRIVIGESAILDNDVLDGLAPDPRVLENSYKSYATAWRLLV